MKTGNVFDNPMLHFISYGIANPTVVWALERGLYDDWCPQCRGRGVEILRPCACVETGIAFCPDHQLCGPDGCPCCRRRCLKCNGDRLRDSRKICRQDFGDDASLAVARQFLSTRDFARDFYAEQLR